ncbi:uncharacterized protein LOC123542322 [Mercenaria mercenaria]|uniref:uncharacterized protein LOC123542322 n=1 Tax=Mercenaria mercenaria TaxID=6596 RepID=UPI00234E8514|nr:uncharacterized protein LOC123542322 [Mercenaria mercenaria]
MPGQGKAKSKQKQGMASKSAPRSTVKRKAVATNSTQPPKQPKRQSVVEDPNQDANNELDAMNGDIMSERLEKLIESKINDIVKRSLAKLDHETLSDATQQCTKPTKDSVTVPSGSEEKSREDNQPSASTSSLSTSGTGDSGCFSSLTLQTSPTIPLYASVPTKIKKKIWSNEYLDFSTAFNKTQESFQFTISQEGVSSISQTHVKKFITIEQWTDTFAIFSSVYRQRYPEQAEQLA